MEETRPSDKSSKALMWKAKAREIGITSLTDLLSVMASIKQECIDEEISANKDKLIEWLEQNFPKELDLVTGIKGSLKEFTPQQMRELIIRKLRKIIKQS